MLMDVWGECSDHDPPHTVDINTDASGEYFPDEHPFLPEHHCE